MRRERTLRILLASLALLLSAALLIPEATHAEPPRGRSSASNARSSGSGSSRRTQRVRYEVQPGDTVGEIAEKFGVRSRDIVRWNRLRDEHTIRIGQTLTVHTTRGGGSRGGGSTRRIVYVVKRGDTLIEIAEKHNVSIRQIQNWNSSLRRDPHDIRVGQRIAMMVSTPEATSGSVGRANRGQLVNGEQLRGGRGLRVRNARRAYGTNHTVSNLLAVAREVQDRYPRAPDVVIGDLSFEEGGPMRPHRSHQSGRDVDIGYFHTGNRQLETFERMNHNNLDVEKTWYFIKALLDTGEVEYIFVDYSIQKLLYEYATAHGVSASYLAAHLQYPRGKGSTSAEVRHARGHINHMHVRFECARGDGDCH